MHLHGKSYADISTFLKVVNCIVILKTINCVVVLLILRLPKCAKEITIMMREDYTLVHFGIAKTNVTYATW